MANTVDEYWTWTPPGGSATSLHQPQWSIATIGGSRFGLPQLRGQDYEVPFRTGMSWRPKYANERTITLVMYVAGISPSTGNPAADQRTQWNNNWQALRALFWNRSLNGSQQGTLTRQWYVQYPNSSLQMVSASALAEIAGTMEPTMTGRTRADFSVDLLLADPYFYGVTQNQTLNMNTPANVTNLGEGVVGEGTGLFTLKFNGPLTIPTLTNTTAGVSVTLGLSLANGYSITLDCVNYTAIDSLSASQIQYVTHAGSRLWMGLLSGINSLTLSSQSGADSGNVQLSWQPPYV